MSPESGNIRPMMCLISTLLPVPDGPSTTVIVSSGIATFRPFRTGAPPSRLCTSMQRIDQRSSSGSPSRSTSLEWYSNSPSSRSCAKGPAPAAPACTRWPATFCSPACAPISSSTIPSPPISISRSRSRSPWPGPSSEPRGVPSAVSIHRILVGRSPVGTRPHGGHDRRGLRVRSKPPRIATAHSGLTIGRQTVYDIASESVYSRRGAEREAGTTMMLHRRTALALEPSAPTRSADPRRRILDAFVRATALRGYDHTTIDHVLMLAEVQAPVFDEHFEDKQDCLLAALDDLIDRARCTLSVRVQGQAPWPERVRTGLHALLVALGCHPDGARVAFVECLSAGEPAIARMRSALAGFVPILEEGRDASR